MSTTTATRTITGREDIAAAIDVLERLLAEGREVSDSLPDGAARSSWMARHADLMRVIVLLRAELVEEA